MMWQRGILLCGLNLAALLIISSVQAGDITLVGKTWPASQRVSMDQVDHRPWDVLLQKYVDPKGMVNYTAWNASPSDIKELDNYLASLSRASARNKSSREGVLAYWINAYNAVTIKGILREYPTTSIRNHTAKVFGYNIWKDLQLVVGDQKVPLDSMEHQALRKMNEPRIHFAIVCASIGCPKLSQRAYFPQSLDAQLTQNARDFFADRTKFRYDSARGQIEISPILKWFAEDFGSTQAEQMKNVAPYLPDPKAQSLAKSGRVSVSYLDYDWNLNDWKTPLARGAKSASKVR